MPVSDSRFQVIRTNFVALRRKIQEMHPAMHQFLVPQIPVLLFVQNQRCIARVACCEWRRMKTHQGNQRICLWQSSSLELGKKHRQSQRLETKLFPENLILSSGKVAFTEKQVNDSQNAIEAR